MMSMHVRRISYTDTTTYTTGDETDTTAVIVIYESEWGSTSNHGEVDPEELSPTHSKEIMEEPREANEWRTPCEPRAWIGSRKSPIAKARGPPARDGRNPPYTFHAAQATVGG